ncbi:MAG: hypothetical protein R2794_09705 [Chitinophagales bacterium]
MSFWKKAVPISKNFWKGFFMFVTAGLLMYVISLDSKNMTNKEAISETNDESAVGSGGRLGLFMLVYFAILHEGFETVLFLWPAYESGCVRFSYVGFAGLCA